MQRSASGVVFQVTIVYILRSVIEHEIIYDVIYEGYPKVTKSRQTLSDTYTPSTCTTPVLRRLDSENITKSMLAPSPLLIGLGWLCVVFKRYAAGKPRVIVPFHVVLNFRKLFRPRLSPLNNHDCREYSDEEEVGDHDVDDNGCRALDKSKSYGRVCDSGSHDGPAKVSMDGTEECSMPFALVDHMIPPAYQELNDCCDEDHNANGLVTTGLFLAVVVRVANGETYETPNNCDYRCCKLSNPVPAYAIQKAEGNGSHR